MNQQLSSLNSLSLLPLLKQKIFYTESSPDDKNYTFSKYNNNVDQNELQAQPTLNEYKLNKENIFIKRDTNIIPKFHRRNMNSYSALPQAKIDEMIGEQNSNQEVKVVEEQPRGKSCEQVRKRRKIKVQYPSNYNPVEQMSQLEKNFGYEQTFGVQEFQELKGQSQNVNAKNQQNSRLQSLGDIQFQAEPRNVLQDRIFQAKKFQISKIIVQQQTPVKLCGEFNSAPNQNYYINKFEWAQPGVSSLQKNENYKIFRHPQKLEKLVKMDVDQKNSPEKINDIQGQHKEIKIDQTKKIILPALGNGKNNNRYKNENKILVKFFLSKNIEKQL